MTKLPTELSEDTQLTLNIKTIAMYQMLTDGYRKEVIEAKKEIIQEIRR